MLPLAPVLHAEQPTLSVQWQISAAHVTGFPPAQLAEPVAANAGVGVSNSQKVAATKPQQRERAEASAVFFIEVSYRGSRGAAFGDSCQGRAGRVWNAPPAR